MTAIGFEVLPLAARECCYSSMIVKRGNMLRKFGIYSRDQRLSLASEREMQFRISWRSYKNHLLPPLAINSQTHHCASVMPLKIASAGSRCFVGPVREAVGSVI